MATDELEMSENHPGAEPSTRLPEERTQEPWNSASQPGQSLDATQLSQRLYDLESSDWNTCWRGLWWSQDRPSEWTSGQTLMTLGGSHQVGELLGQPMRLPSGTTLDDKRKGHETGNTTGCTKVRRTIEEARLVNADQVRAHQ